MIDFTSANITTSIIKDDTTFVTTEYSEQICDLLLHCTNSDVKLSPHLGTLDYLQGRFEMIFDSPQCGIFPTEKDTEVWLANIDGYVLSPAHSTRKDVALTLYISFKVSDLCRMTKKEVYEDYI